MTKKYLIISMVSVLIMMIGVSLAYFTPRITGEGNDITVNIKDIKIIFTDNSSAITASNIEAGWNTSKTFSVKNESDAAYLYNIVIKDLVNTFKTYGNLEYKIESTNNGYTTNNNWIDVPKSLGGTDTPIAFNVSIPVGVTQNYTIYFRYNESAEDQSEDLGKTFSGSIAIKHGTNPTLVSKLLEINPTRLTRTSFDDVLTTENTGTLYTTQNTEDGSLVYYFAGNALNNWVKFGKCTSADYNCTVGEDLYWRIIRTNTVLEDGGIRLLYAGSGSVANQNAYITSSYYAPSRVDPMYSGYMYGTTGSLANNRTNQINKSNAATAISSWYTVTFNTSSDINSKDSSGNLLTNYISKTAIYCNDRSVRYGTYNTGSNTFYFSGNLRVRQNRAPSYACGATTSGFGYYYEGSTSIADKFTGIENNKAGTTIGNGLLGSTPAALITADELTYAGGVISVNASTWYYYNAASTPGSITGSTLWWTMTPYQWGDNMASVFMMHGSASPGQLASNTLTNSRAIRPVISLKASVLWDSGDGSPSNPFTVKLAD